jgi:hypothetical protein
MDMYVGWMVVHVLDAIGSQVTYESRHQWTCDTNFVIID